MKFFQLREFDCRCRRGIACDAPPMQKPFLNKLEALREEWGKPLIVTSGRRCRLRNTQENGAEHSQHLFGNASDFRFIDASESQRFALLAEKFGFNGIGLGVTLVHIDNREKRAHWSYDA